MTRWCGVSAYEELRRIREENAAFYATPEGARWKAQLNAEGAESERRQQADEERRAAQRLKAAERNERRRVWRAGVAKIMAEVRRREAERVRLHPEPPFYSSDNPLDGMRLWA